MPLQRGRRPTNVALVGTFQARAAPQINRRDADQASRRKHVLEAFHFADDGRPNRKAPTRNDRVRHQHIARPRPCPHQRIRVGGRTHHVVTRLHDGCRQMADSVHVGEQFVRREKAAMREVMRLQRASDSASSAKWRTRSGLGNRVEQLPSYSLQARANAVWMPGSGSNRRFR